MKQWCTQGAYKEIQLDESETQCLNRTWCKRFGTYRVIFMFARGCVNPRDVRMSKKRVLKYSSRENFKNSRDQKEIIEKERPKMFSISNKNDLGKRSVLVVIQKEIQKGLV